MHIHILGICGTFMGGIALLARAMGHEVSGSDTNVYPPMSTQLEEQGIQLMEGYDPSQLDPAPDCVVIGNAMSRGNPAVEAVLDRNLPYMSGPEFLSRHVLPARWVLAVAGTHGKTTTSSMLAWILEHAGLQPGFLIGGIPANFGLSARLGQAPFFVIEADEYDTAFFDKRSKFVHYHPRTLVLNNLEFDHADIFPDLDAIKRQFHHLVRTVPGSGLILSQADEAALEAVLSMGCWTPVERMGAAPAADWQVRLSQPDGSAFEVIFRGQTQGHVAWPLMGLHNVYNGVMAIAAARHAGVPAAEACDGLSHFENVKRRMELRGEVAGVRVYDDFAHHPTAIATTLQGLRHHVGDQRIVAVLEPRSNTMRMGVHQDRLAASLSAADAVYLYQPSGLDWALGPVRDALTAPATLCGQIDELIGRLVADSAAGDHIVIMSNGGFDNIHQRLLDALAAI